MGRQRRSTVADPRVGTYPISTGKAEVRRDEFRDDAYVLLINGVPSSHIVPDHPEELEFEYMRWIAAAIDTLVIAPAPASTPRITHLGGGACSLARYFAHTCPGSHNTVVELDAKLAQLVRELFEIPRAPAVKIRAGEARAVTEGFAPASREVIIRDVFAGDTTPRPLTTVEFFHAARRALTPSGLYVANCGDHSDLSVAKAEIAGLRRVFAHVACIADPPMLKGRRYGNIILLASDTPLPHDATPAHAKLAKRLLTGAVPAHYKDEEWTARLAAGHTPLADAPSIHQSHPPHRL